jgi:Protein of unknown function (DUF2970)
MNIEHDNQSNKPSIFRVIRSIIAAGIGIQTETNRRRDFQEGASPTIYVIVGLIATAVFIFTVIMIVKLVVHSLAGN